MNRATRENIGRVLGSSNSSVGNLDAGDLHFTTQAELLAACLQRHTFVGRDVTNPTSTSRNTATNRHVKHLEKFSSHSSSYLVAAHPRQIHERHTLLLWHGVF